MGAEAPSNWLQLKKNTSKVPRQTIIYYNLIFKLIFSIVVDAAHELLKEQHNYLSISRGGSWGHDSLPLN